MTYFSIFWFFIVLSSLFFTSFTDPGIIFKNDYQLNDVEAASSSQAVNIIECVQCHINRPSTARHCYQCNVCVDQVIFYIKRNYHIFIIYN